MSEEYKELKEITASAIYDAGDKTSSCFRQQYQKFLVWADGHYKALGQDYFHFFIEMAISTLQAEFEKYPEWETFLINKGFIEKVAPPEKFYKAGDKFILSDICGPLSYMLAIVARSHMQLLSQNGCLFFGEPPIKVEDINNITMREFSLIARGRPDLFTKEEDTK